MEEKRIYRVAIVGGGCAGMAAAWQLSKLKNYKVDVYEAGWRLGGKGSSWRDEHGRIREHGLHVWLGFYENAFRMIRECYDEVWENEWKPGAKSGNRLPHGSFDEAFSPAPHVGVTGENRAGTREVWSGMLPPTPGLPGDDLDEATNPFTLKNYLSRTLMLIKTLVLSMIGPMEGEKPGAPAPDRRSRGDEALDLDFSPDSIAADIEKVTRILRGITLTSVAGALQVVSIIERMLQSLDFSPQTADSILRILEAVTTQVRKQLRDVSAIDEHIRWKADVIDIVMTIVVGLYRDRIFFPPKRKGEAEGLDRLNHIDYREWLEKHGATRSSLESPFLKGIYELVFAYRDGDPKKPALAAGVALRGALRLFFTYRGAMFWRMNSGMGDAVFAPLYKTLTSSKRRPDPDKEKEKDGPRRVTFHFGHKLTAIEFAGLKKEDGKKTNRQVKSLEFTKRKAKDGADHDPTDHFGCWKPDPKEEEIVETVLPPLAFGTDFDAVILAIGVDDLGPLIPNEVRTALPEWETMLASVKTVATKAAQVWLNAGLDKLGWYRGSAVISALGSTFETWADMTQTLPSEALWRKYDDGEPGSGRDGSRSVAYFCSVLPDAIAKKPNVVTRVRNDVHSLLKTGMRPFWPRAYVAVNPPRLVGKKGKALEPAFHDTAPASLADHSHIQINATGSARYTLSLPGTIRQRISPLEKWFTNMTIAGDWTACGLDAGCVEAAVTSGMLAARAISGFPSRESIIGFDHP